LLPEDGLHGVLQAAIAGGDGEIAILADAATTTDPEHWRQGIEAVLGNRCDGWLHANAQAGGVLARPFKGALISRQAIQAVLDRCEALGHTDAALTLGLTARLQHAPDQPTHSVTADLAHAARQAATPHSRLADTHIGMWLLDGLGLVHGRLPRIHSRIAGVALRLFDADGLVDGPAYLKANPDVAAANLDPSLHYLRHGWREGRLPRPSADAKVAQDLYPVVARNIAANGPAHLLVLHSYGGGTMHYAGLVADVLRRHDLRPIFAWGVDEREFFISTTAPYRAERRFVLPDDIDATAAQLRRFGVVRVDVLHAAGSEKHLPALLRALGVPYDVTLLDYHLFAHEPHLLEGKKLTLARGQSDETSAIAALLRSDVHPLLEGAARLLACSRDLAARLHRLAPGLRIQAVRPPEPVHAETFRVTPPAAIAADEALRILVLGHLVSSKGRQEMLAVATQAKRRGLKLTFHHIGILSEPISPREQSSAALSLYGRFDREHLITLVNGIRPHLAWFPAQAPETYGFTLSEVMSMGLPILARGIGAYAERLAGRAFTWVVPAEEQSTEFWLDQLIALRDSGLNRPSNAVMPADLPPLLEDFYDRSYV
jgi:glycosyltransferase involved in cell wall biosynthesis